MNTGKTQYHTGLRHIRKLQRVARERLVEFVRERVKIGTYISFEKGKMNGPSEALVLDISGTDGRIRIQNEKTGTKRWVEPECLR